MGEGRKRQKKSLGVCKLKVTLVGPMGNLQLELLLRVVLAEAKVARFLFFSIPQSLHVGYLGQQGSISAAEASPAEASSIPGKC